MASLETLTSVLALSFGPAEEPEVAYRTQLFQEWLAVLRSMSHLESCQPLKQLHVRYVADMGAPYVELEPGSAEATDLDTDPQAPPTDTVGERPPLGHLS